MRKTAFILATAIVLWDAYSAWPFWGLYELAKSVQARDLAAIAERTDFAAVRNSLTEQILRTHLRLTGREARLSPFRREIIVAVTSTVADPVVAKLVSPAALADLLVTGWPTAVLPHRPAGVDGFAADRLGSVWQLYANAEYRLRDFYVSVPVAKPPEQQFRLRFRLSNWTWKLSGVELPVEIQEALARLVIREQDAAKSGR
jgi:hypothetical protein